MSSLSFPSFDIQQINPISEMQREKKLTNKQKRKKNRIDDLLDCLPKEQNVYVQFVLFWHSVLDFMAKRERNSNQKIGLNEISMYAIVTVLHSTTTVNRVPNWNP